MKESFGQTNMKLPIIHALVNHNYMIEVFKFPLIPVEHPTFQAVNINLRILNKRHHL